MRILHVALVRSSEAASDRFFGELLGLEKTRRKLLSADLASALFGLEREYELLYYGNADVQFEIFLSEREDRVQSHVGHVCLGVRSVEDLVVKCDAMGVTVKRVERGDSFVTFIEDEDGNLFELKENT